MGNSEAFLLALVGVRSRRWWCVGIAGASAVLVMAGLAAVLWPDSAAWLETTPSGASVAIDGRAVGTTPLRLASRPAPLDSQVEVSLNGFRSWRGTVAAGIGELRTVSLALEPLPATLEVSTTPPGAAVQLGVVDMGSTPLTIEGVLPGTHELIITLQSYQSESMVVELEPGGHVSQNVQLVPLPKPQASAPASSTELAMLAPAALQEASVQTTELLPAHTAAGMLPAIPPPSGDGPVRPLAIMVENAPEARPQSGLAAADVVYEAMAEGGISRFMAVYLTGDAKVVGPVRSARHYFVHLAAEFGAALVHIGSSPMGYDVIRALGMPNMDETYDRRGFWRSRHRWAPHNAYTSVAGARESLGANLSVPAGTWAAFTFKDPSTPYTERPAPGISIEYQPWHYRVEYRHDAASNRYARFMAGAPHVDAESRDQLFAANVAVVRVDAWIIDDAGRLDMALVGGGAAVYLVDGAAIEGAWKKASETAPMELLDSTGRSVRFNPGPIWVQLVHPDTKVSF